jgi:hypothetical protein
MRYGLTFVLWVVGFFCSVGISIAIGVSAGSFLVGLIVFAVCMVGLYMLTKFIFSYGRVDMSAWLASVDNCKYKYAWDGDGVAVDLEKRKLFITSRFNKLSVQKSYSFADIREWGYEIPGLTQTKTYGNVGVNAALQVGAENMAALAATKSNTGLWFKVRDIDYPKWFINFGHNPSVKRVDTELDRWMEILRQNLNET